MVPERERLSDFEDVRPKATMISTGATTRQVDITPSATRTCQGFRTIQRPRCFRRRRSDGLSTPEMYGRDRRHYTPPRTMGLRLGDTSFRDFGFHTITARHKYRVRVLESHFPPDKTGSYFSHLSFLLDRFQSNPDLSSRTVQVRPQPDVASDRDDRQSRYMLHPDAR
jgi:hypothetical protein